MTGDEVVQVPAVATTPTRRFMLRSAVAAVAAGGALALAACGQTGEGGAGGSTEARPVTLNVLMGTAGAEPILDKLKESFKRAHPNVTVEYSEISGTAPTQQKILTLAASGSLPDTLPEHPNFVTDIAEKGILSDLQPFASKDKGVDLPDFYTGVIDHFRHKGVLYGLPWNSGPSIIYFNRGLLERLSIKTPDQYEKEGKWDWAAFQEVARLATKGTGADRTMGFQSPNMNLDWFDAWVWQAGGDVFSKDMKKCLLAEPPAVQAAQYMADLYLKDRVVPVGNDAKDFPNGVESGKVALRFGNKDQANVIDQKAKENAFKPGLAPTPKGKGGRVNRDGPQANGIGKTTKEPDTAWVYVKHMSSLETQKIRLDAKLTTPVRKSAAKTPEFTRSLFDWEVGEYWSDAANTVRPLAKPTRYTDVGNAWSDMWKRISAGEIAVRAGMEEVTRQIDGILAQG
jgi:multiple sugar transport system substrate-binding protein